MSTQLYSKVFRIETLPDRNLDRQWELIGQMKDVLSLYYEGWGPDVAAFRVEIDANTKYSDEQIIAEIDRRLRSARKAKPNEDYELHSMYMRDLDVKHRLQEWGYNV